MCFYDYKKQDFFSGFDLWLSLINILFLVKSSIVNEFTY